MGTNLPFGRRKTLNWLEGRIESWTDDPAANGLTSAQVASLTQSIETAREDYTSAQAVRAHSKAVTNEFHASADALHQEGADLITAIKAHALTSGNAAGVLTAAGLTGRNDPSPLPAPEQPGNLRANLNGDGSVTITWDGRGPTGTVYNVMRQLPGEMGFIIVGQGSGRNKSITEKALPAGTTQATYLVQAVRGSQISPPSAAISVLFSAPAAATTAQAA